MKIGILTWFFADNYGARAQSYALQETLSSLGHDVHVINYVTFRNWLLNLKMCINHPGCKLNPIKIVRDLFRHFIFLQEKSIYKKSPKVNGADDINKLQYDLVIFGSDAVFNLLHPMGGDIYYGVGVNTRKATYSPSCEYLKPNFILSQNIIDSLKNMGTVSVRDERTKQLLVNNGIHSVEKTLDPTLLYNFDSLSKSISKDEYILVYTFSDWDEHTESIRQYAKNKGLKIISVGRECRWADKSLDLVGLKKWVGAFRGASIVVTDSFHGTIFSIKYDKEIILLSRKDKIAKISSLLDQLGVSKPIYKVGDDVESYLNESRIDYVSVNEKLNVLVQQSMAYLKSKLLEA